MVDRPIGNIVTLQERAYENWTFGQSNQLIGGVSVEMKSALLSRVRESDSLSIYLSSSPSPSLSLYVPLRPSADNFTQ